MKKIILSLIMLFTTGAFAAKPTTPNPTDALAYGAKYISVSDAKALYDNGAIFLDTRKPLQYSKQHIKGAKRAYYNEKGGNKNKLAKWDNSKDKFKTKDIPSDKNTKLITYCNGKNCWKSYKAAVALTKMGYTNVNWLREGIPGWIKSGYPVE